MTPLEETIRNQRAASDPSGSAFVMANAGAGKTRVLTHRVARLLLENAPPDKILCITFTKAAAAEMADRLFTELGEWALLDDENLSTALAAIEGEAARQRDANALAAARRLFARALETPGGLKIQTIHSFCETVLRRFPLEAGAPPGFTIIEETEAARLLEEAVDAAARRAAHDPALAACFDRLGRKHSEQQLRQLLPRASGPVFDAALAVHGSLDALLDELAHELGADPKASDANICAAFIASIDAARLEDARAALHASGKNAKALAEKSIAVFLRESAAESQWSALAALFLKTDGAPRGKYGDKQTQENAPWVNDYLCNLEEQFLTADNMRKTASIYQDTAAWHRLLAQTRSAYHKAKQARAALDFDDLVERTRRLLRNTASAWVMYKLDQGIDHILVDESQDTSPAQWAVIESLMDDYLSGGRRDAGQTFFAVGDIKQSIYSFQGADAALFEEKEAELGKRLAAAGAYKNVDLKLSFRTTAPVLTFVDALFDDPEAAEGLGKFGAPKHGVKRIGEGGLVEIWPLTPRPEKTTTNAWDAPVDAPEPGHPVQVLSERIASTIKDWIDKDVVLESQGRPITPGDVMILVQSRGPLFDETIRRLAQKNIPVAGADRLKLLEDPAVEDLIAYAKAALTPADDLSLAEVLKSPLFGFDDDADLFPLAHHRPPQKSLWASLSSRAGEHDTWADAARRIARARSIGLKEGPFAFLSATLETGAPSGRKRFYTRLSPSSRDAVDEMLRQALDFETENPRSLRLFTDWFESNAGEIKREMERADDAVRVMTVHGAKGLEANIVFLIDAHRGPNLGLQDPSLSLDSADGGPPIPVLAGSARSDAIRTAAAREIKNRAAYEEYRRLLYVAATRARDRLYVCGHALGNDRSPRAKPTAIKSWHALALDAFERLGGRIDCDAAPAWPDGEEPIQRLTLPQTAPVEPAAVVSEDAAVKTPAWLFQPAQAETAPLRLAPSRLAGEESGPTPADAPALSPSETDRYFRGRILHRLLELLPEAPETKRPALADRLLERLAPRIEAEERARWRDEVLSILSDEKFAQVFSQSSRAEVGIAGKVKGPKGDIIVSGQIDRLVVEDSSVLIVDYKTNRPPPARIEDTAPAYLAQMAAYRALLQEIYPTHQIETALLWTFEARLMALPDAVLDHAFARLSGAG
ncbi:MAG: double-strand break repair helicase AddA [Hyphococcus sp.]